MNLVKKGDSASDVMQGIGRLAKQKASKDPEYTPILLTMIDADRDDFRTTGFDIFVLSTSAHASSRRPVKTVSIRKTSETNFREKLNFAQHPESFELYAYVPKTEHNMRVLASHLRDRFWTIEPPEVEQEAIKIAETMDHIRTPEVEHALPDINQIMKPAAGPQHLQLEEAKREIEELKEKQKESERMQALIDENRKLKDELAGKAEIKEEEKEEEEAFEPKLLRPDGKPYYVLHKATPENFKSRLKEETRLTLQNEHADWLAAHKKRYEHDKRQYWLQPDYKKMLKDIQTEILKGYYQKD